MAEKTDVKTDDRGIPIVDPSRIPNHTDGITDWRAAADEIREEHPYFKVGDDPVIWFSRFEDAKVLYEDWKLFSNEKEYDFPFLIPLDLDPPDSIAWRRAMQNHFNIPYVKSWEPRMREKARELIDGFIADGEVDFITGFAQQHFPIIAAEWMGVPESDRAKLVEWQHGVFHIPADGDAGTGVQMGNDAMAEMSEYLEGLLKEKKRNPDDSFTSFIAQLDGGDALEVTDRDRLAIVNMMAIGAAHTTSAHIGYVWYYLANNPEARKLMTDPESIEAACEEIHRLLPLYGIPRTVTRDENFNGCPLHKGDKVFSLYSQPNRDPRQEGFDHEDLDRRSNPHLGFQRGVHRCLGIHWAKVARRAAIEEWHAAIPEYRIKPGAQLTEQVHSGVGFHNLPLVWDV